MQQKYNICSWMLTRFVSAFFENRILLSELLNEILDLLKTAVQTILSEKNMNMRKKIFDVHQTELSPLSSAILSISLCILSVGSLCIS